MGEKKNKKQKKLMNTIYDFVEKTLKDDSPNPQALAIVPSMMDILERNSFREKTRKREFECFF